MTGGSLRAISLIVSMALHAAVFAAIAVLFGDNATGPAESSSTLHVSVLSSEPADNIPMDNPDLSAIEQSHVSKRVVQQPIHTPEVLKVRTAPTKTEIVHKQENMPIPSPTPTKQLASNHKGADVKEKKPMQIASSGRYTRLSRDYRSTLLRLIERHKYYPLRARRNGIEGTSTVTFTVSSNGSISGISLARSSGTTLLDQAAIQTIQRIDNAPPLPEGIGRSKWKFVIPLAYNIR